MNFHVQINIVKTPSFTFCFLGLLFSLSIWAQDKNGVKNNFLFEEINITDDDGLHSWSDIEQFHQSSDGVLWFQINEGLFRFNGNSAINITKHLSSKGIRLDDQPTTRFLFDDNDNLWLGRRKGLFKISLETNNVQEIHLDQPANPQNWRNYILELEMLNDTIYVGSANGLYLIDKNSGKKLKSYLTNGKDLRHLESTKAVQSIFPNVEEGAIWAALMDGLYRIDKNKGTIKRHLATAVWPDTLAHNFFGGHLIDEKLYLSSYGLGMVEFDFKSKAFKRYPTSARHANDYSYNIIKTALKISDSTMFINAAKMGNAIFNIRTKKYKWLPTPDPLKGGVFLYLDRSGHVWGSKRGRLHRTIGPIVSRKKKNRPNLDIAAFYANGRLLIRPSIDGYHPIELTENENNIKLDFTLTEPHLYRDLRYEYQLNQESWRPVHDKNKLELFGLDSGAHTLKLRVKDNAKNVLASAKIDLNLIVPFYKTSLFIISLGLLIILLSYFFINYFNQKTVSRRLKEIDALKTNFFTNISHEFRTPLTLISAPLQESLEDPKLSNEKRRHLEIAQRSTKKLSSLVDQLLELSKIDAGQRKLIVQKNTPTQMIAAWSESFVYLAQQKEINLETEIRNKEVAAWFDVEALENIVVNLLGNAIKYTPNYGEIKLQASIEHKRLTITIKNTGKGLKSKQIATIFNRFYQTDGQNEGAGVGLSLVKELTELHGGKIKVTSEPHKWTLFEVTICLDKAKLKNVEVREKGNVLPSFSTPHPERPLLKEEKPPHHKELPILLIVEDNTDVRILLADTFKKESRIVQAVNGEEGIVKALDIIPDMIISDVMMPVKDGVALTKNLKNDERTSHIPIILLTAKAGDENELTGIEVGADDYMTKPFNQKILKSKTASLLALRKKLQSRYSQEVILKPKDIAITSIDEKFLDKVQKILDEKLVEPTFSTEQFSKAIYMSRMQLHRKLKALTGLSTSEFIRSQRLKLAVQILKSSDINISQVGYSVGFNDHAYFSKCFKEAYNCTPSEFGKEKQPA